MLVSCSSDCTIRVWTPDGKFIGTFGQAEVWNLYDPQTYQHPCVPYDVLIDDQSLPQHPILNRKETLSDVLDLSQDNDKNKEKEVS